METTVVIAVPITHVIATIIVTVSRPLVVATSKVAWTQIKTFALAVSICIIHHLPPLSFYCFLFILLKKLQDYLAKILLMKFSY